MTAPSGPRRGRPLDPAVGDAVLAAVLEVLAEQGYDGLRVADVARRAGTGLGALYRRWPTKRALVLAAVSSLASDEPPAPTGDPSGDVLAVLDEIATAIAAPESAMLIRLLIGADPGLADALRNAKLAPQLARLRERLRAALGDVADLELRTELGPALITFRALVLRRTITRRELQEEILPQLLRTP